MATLGIELSDVGSHCVIIEDSGGSRLLSIGNSGERFPAYIYAQADDLHFGLDAQEVAQVYPRRVCSEFIDDLSFQAVHLEGHRERLTYSKIAYNYLQNLVKEVSKDVEKIDKAIVAVPGHYLEANEKSEQRLGLLLGILDDLEIPVAGIVDMAASSLYSEGLWNLPEGESIFHFDLLLHATHITVFQKRNGLNRVHFSRLPQYGFAKMLETFTGSMAYRFLKQTSFDITEDRRIERAFHAQTQQMLFSLGRTSEASLEVTTRERSRQMTVSRDVAAIDLAPQVKILTQMLLRAINDYGSGNNRVRVMLSERAATIQGIKDAIISQGIGEVEELPNESGAFGAANYGKSWSVPKEIEDTRIETGISLEGVANMALHGDTGKWAAVNVTQLGKSLNPTHLVLGGLAYELMPQGFTIGFGTCEEFDLSLESSAQSKPAELCRLSWDEDKWALQCGKGVRLEPVDIGGIKAGDTIDFLVQGRRHSLSAIHCMQ